MAFIHWERELTGYVAKLSSFLARTLLNRAYRDIQESRPWSFLCAEDVIQIPSAVSAGSVTLTQFSNSVIPDATAKAAWATIGNPLITQRQFRLAKGPIYNIVGYNAATGVITLDRNYQEAGGVGITYLLYRCYVPAPAKDFLRWVSVQDFTNGYWLKLHYTKREIDKKDPQRAYFGPPTRIVAYKSDSNQSSPTFGYPLFELWAHPQKQISYPCVYQRRGLQFVNPTDDLPPAIPEDVLMWKARAYCYEWAEASKGTIPDLRGSDWRFLMTHAEAEYKKALWQAQKEDEETFLQHFIPPDEAGAYLGPIDAAFMQSHDTGL